MKRIGSIYQKIISVENLTLADSKARNGKRKSYGVITHDKNREENIKKLHQELKDKTFINSDYDTFYIHKPKKRLIYRLPYYPDRIVHHAVMNYMEPIWKEVFTADTYSCIKGKGIHACQRKIQADLRGNIEETTYCLKIDIKKFYPTVDHGIMKQILRRKLKDKDLLWLLDNIISSAPGLPIGNYLSQYFANLYLAYFDHWLKEEKRVKYYYRYADDIVVLHKDKQYLHKILADIRTYLQDELKLEIKENYQVFPVSSRGIDFVGYVFFHTHTLLRKRIKKEFARKVKNKAGRESLVSYMGWAKHCDSKNLIKKLNIKL